MKNRFNFLVAALFFAAVLINAQVNKSGEEEKMFSSITGITVKDMAGNDINLSEYNGKVLIIVNVASKCGYTPQYADLQKVYSEYKDKGLEILAFPCNDFGGQEPGTNSEIQEFCTSNYGVTFKLFDKIKVLGEEKSPLYERLTNSEAVEKGDIKWNFEKFIISKDGNIIERFRSKVKPTSEEFLAVVKSELAK